jgi:hypothetical protein
MVVLLLGLEIYLAWSYRAAFAPMLKRHVTPTSALAARSEALADGPTFSPNQPAHR